MIEYKVIKTKDGSDTIIDQSKNETFHSINGAINESIHIFINNGLKTISKNELKILEIGFGSGLNCLLTYLKKEPKQIVTYHTIDLFPIHKGLYESLNFFNELNVSHETYLKIMDIPWDNEVKAFNNFYLKKIRCNLLDFETNYFYDIIYFDAFSPNVQPELWTFEIFQKLFCMLLQSGIIITYSSKGDVKRALRKAQFEVHRLSGPKGKRHILKAIKYNK